MSTTEHKIGEIADLTGLTVRTLRYYEEIDLISPASRTDAGHRLYGPDSIQRLYKIAMLRQLGLPLNAIQATLEADRTDLSTMLTEHLAAVEARVTAESRLRGRLLSLVSSLEHIDESEIVTGDLLNVLEDMTMLETTLDRRIAILVYEDIEAAFEELKTTFGFGPGELTRTPDGDVVHGEIQAGDGEFWLHPESPEFKMHSPKNLGGATGSMAVIVDDVDAHYAYAVENGATITYAPIDQPYGYREYSAVDSGGHLWSFMKPLG